MKNSKNNPSFKGRSKNRNKRLHPVDRKVIHTKKHSRKEFDKKIVAREGIAQYVDMEVSVSAELVYFNRKDPLGPSLIEHVYINDEYVDHMWVVFNIEDRYKLKMCYEGCRILFTAIVQRYIKKKDRQIDIKYGIVNPKLLKE